MNTIHTPIIGMEIHVELATSSKMFCGCKNDPFYAPSPNIYTCPTCLGLPGGLPVPNRKAIEWTIKLGFALGCEIQEFSKFDRKNYFYPDLAKGYQISQYDQPFCRNGLIRLPQGDVRIHRVHLEEDTGKLLHNTIEGEKVTLVDFNRSGVPLVEIVTEPDIHSSEQAKMFLKKLHQIIRYLEISGADMEKGSMRLEPNISVQKTENPSASSGQGRKQKAEELPSYKVEVKNINSFNFVKKAIDFEVKRHIGLLEKGETPKQETRGYVESTSSTVSQRSKEDAMDYRYFPEPDIPPFRFSADEREVIKKQLPELPDEKIVRFMTQYGLKDTEAILLIDSKDRADYFESCVALIESNETYKKISPNNVAKAIINRVQDGTVISPRDLISDILTKIDNNSLDRDVIVSACKAVIAQQSNAAEDFRKGKTTVLMFLVGQTKKILQGKGDAKLIESILKELI